jgi:glycosyl transferase, family 25
MHAFVINMDRAIERWNQAAKAIESAGISYERLPAVDGRALKLPIKEFDASAYRLRHGRRPNLATIGCYISHLKAWQALLDSPHEYGIICEDDIQIDCQVPLRTLLQKAIDFRESWDILRLCGFHNSHPRCFAPLAEGYSLAVNLTRLSGSAAYMLHRTAAEHLLERLVPMSLPLDHALDREWVYGLKAASIYPLPINQEDHAFVSQIQTQTHEKIPSWQRYWTVFPYRAANEVSRLISRSIQFRKAKSTEALTS